MGVYYYINIPYILLRILSIPDATSRSKKRVKLREIFLFLLNNKIPAIANLFNYPKLYLI